MKYFQIILALFAVGMLVVILIASWEPADAPPRVTDSKWLSQETEKVRYDVEQIVAGYDNFNAQPIVERTHPNVILADGGVEPFRLKLETLLEKSRGVNVKSERFNIIDKPEFFRIEDDEFVFVRTQSAIDSSNGRFQMIGFFVGHKKKGEDNWGYIDASNGRSGAESVIRRYLPNLPFNISIPKCSHKRLPAKPQNE